MAIIRRMDTSGDMRISHDEWELYFTPSSSHGSSNLANGADRFAQPTAYDKERMLS